MLMLIRYGYDNICKIPSTGLVAFIITVHHNCREHAETDPQQMEGDSSIATVLVYSYGDLVRFLTVTTRVRLY
jgi:hypothetical protein